MYAHLIYICMFGLYNNTLDTGITSKCILNMNTKYCVYSIINGIVQIEPLHISNNNVIFMLIKCPSRL